MKYNLFGYLIGEGFQNAIKNKKGTIACIVSMVASMILFGAFFSLMQNANAFLEKVEQDQGISVYIQNGTTEEQKDELERKIRALDGVETVKYITKEQALEIMKDRMQGQIGNTYDNRNPFPASFVVTFTDLSKNKEIQDTIKTFENVKDITSSDKTIDVLINIVSGTQKFFIGFSALLIIISIVLISNSIKMSIYSRRKEISIMKYVGATNSFIRCPFVVEGVLIGVISAFISLILIAGAYTAIVRALATNIVVQQMGLTFIPFVDIVLQLAGVFVLLGMGIGIVGSSTSMKKYLEV